MKLLFKRLPAITRSQIFQPLKRTLLTLLFTVPQVPIQYPLLGSISSGGKALAQAQTSCPAGTSPTILEWTPTTNLQDFLSQNLSVGGISTTFRFSESSPGVIDPGETLIDPGIYGGLPGPNLRFNIGGNSLGRPVNDRDSSPVEVGSSATLTITFAQPVTLASPLTFLDIDRNGAPPRDPVGRIFQDRVTIRAFNGSTPVGVTGTALGTDTRVTNQGNSVLAEGINDNANTDQNAGNIQVTPAGAITQIQVVYEPGTEFGAPVQDETIGLARLNICAPTGTLGDTVYNDTNGNSQQDAGETGINNVTLNLIGAGPDGQFGTADDITRPAITTDSNGRYSFPGLPAGNYRVTVNNPSGFTATQTQPNAIALAAGQNIDTVDFGFTQQRGSIGDTVFNDTNANGVQDQGEPGIGGVTINLRDSSGNIVPTTTNNNGNYSFPNLTPGDYTVSIPNPPAGFNPTLVPSSIISLQPGQNVDTADFGFTQQPRGSIGDTVFQDLNGNGEQEPDEVGVSGVRIRLFGPGPDGIINTADDNQIAEQFTDNTQNIAIGGRGNYTFINLPLGTYRVESDIPPGNPPNDRAFLTTGRNPIIVNLAVNPNVINADFGFNMTGFSGNNPGSLGDTVFSDRNGNGVQDQGETGISGVSVNLTGAGPDGQFGTADDITRPATTTDDNGKYSFTNLPAGNYRVSINPPSNLPQVTTIGGTQQEQNLQSGQTLNNVDFGLRGGAVGAANTGLRLVKRITNVFRNGQPVNVANFNTFVDDPNDDDDNILNQAGRPPLGVYEIATPLQSGDEVEYTISYLAEGDQEFRNVRFCDLIPPETSYSSGEISVNRAGANSLLTNAQDSDQGAFFTPLQPLPQPNQCLSQTNTKGAVIVNLGTITPDRNFGFLRFRVRID